MAKILKPKMIFVDGKFTITLSNNVMKIVKVVCKEILLYSQGLLQEAHFLNDDGDIDDDGNWLRVVVIMVEIMMMLWW